MEILNNLDPLLQTFWYVAIPTSLIFLIQTILTFVGADTADGLEADISDTSVDDSFQLFSLRNLVNFLLGFSWTGISLFEVVGNNVYLIILSVGVGIVFVYLFYFIISQVQMLAEDNSFDILNTLNKTAEVYLTIPGNKSGKGKVMISVKGSYHELDAMTEQESIKSGTLVKVTKIENDKILIVETI